MRVSFLGKKCSGSRIKAQKWANKKTESGFTLIELLVVIAIIGILAGILFVAINPKEQTDKAKAAKIARDLKAIEEAFQLTALEKNRELYPKETEFNSTNIAAMSSNNELNHLPSKVTPPSGVGANYYSYDNDSDKYVYLNNCPGANASEGVNIYINYVTNNGLSVAEELDKLIDNGNGLQCGRVHLYDNGTDKFLAYILDDNQ